MDFHISVLQALMTLTADPLTLRWLSEGVSRARSDLCRARGNRKVLRKQRRLLARQQSRRAIQVRLPKVGWHNINDTRIGTLSLQDILSAIGTQVSTVEYLKRYWRQQPQINEVSSV